MMSKKTIYWAVSVWLALALQWSSCNDLLDPEVIQGGLVLENDVIYNYDNTEKTANAIYSFLPDGLYYISDALLACASDEADFSLETHPIQKFNTGAWNAVANPDNAWAKNYQGIYAVNLFLVNVDSIDMDYLKYDPARQEEYRTKLSNIDRWKYEVRFLRAFFYFELIKRYGGVPIITAPLHLESDYTAFQRDSLSKCVAFIVEECDSVANQLPVEYVEGSDLGRVTRGAALALKSRLLLYAASDLWNDPSWAGGYEHPEYISLTDNKSRESRWLEAAEAADAVIRLPGAGYALNPSSNGGYSGLFARNTLGDSAFYKNAEVIFARRYGNSNWFETVNYPVGFALANGGVTPTGNMVDAYEKIVGGRGVQFDWSNSDHASKPYADRDPRMEASILINNATFNEREIEAWPGGIDGKGITRATKTGYYLKKYVAPNLNLTEGNQDAHRWIFFRLGEIYLNYAEAINEALGPNGKTANASLTARTAITNLRRRAPMPAVLASITQDGLRDLIRNERRVELAFEDHRLWDVRRWMTAPEALNVPVSGVNISVVSETPIMEAQLDENNQVVFDAKGDTVWVQSINQKYGIPRFLREFSYTENPLVENRKFDTKMYFYPIPLKDLKIAGWAQNPLW
jgi:hypothetical protein